MDLIDRKLLSLLQQDAGQTYADLAQKLNLSAPALHDRVKKLKAKGVLKRLTIDLDAKQLGHAITSIVHVDTEGWHTAEVAEALRKNGRIEEIHCVSGDTCFILKVRSATTEALEDVLHEIKDLPGVKHTTSYVVLRTYLERGPDPLITD